MKDQRVHIVRPPGIKCANLVCPYNDIAYEQDTTRWEHNLRYDGSLCLNCIDDAKTYILESCD
jgi:hypothetical protein